MTCDSQGSKFMNYFNSVSKDDQIKKNWRLLKSNWKNKILKPNWEN